MTAVVRAPLAPGLGAQLRRASVQTWRELVGAAIVGAILLAAAAPPLLAVATGAPLWLVAAATAPLALLLSGLARVAANVADGTRARVRDLTAVDPVLALLGLTWSAGAVWLSTLSDGFQVVGFALSAAWLAVVPRALAYGAARDRRGVRALRGGAILAAYRPGATITIVSLGVVGSFAVVASLGTLALVVPLLLAVFAAHVTADELDAIDSTSGAPR